MKQINPVHVQDSQGTDHYKLKTDCIEGDCMTITKEGETVHICPDYYFLNGNDHCNRCDE